MNKKVSKVMGLIFLVIFGIFFTVYNYWVYCCGPVTTSDNEYWERIEVPSGMTVRQVASVLREKKLIHNATVFYYAARYPWLEKSQMNGFQGGHFQLKSGVYQVSSAMGLSEMFEMFSSGRSADIRIVIPEGLTLHKTAVRIAEAGVCSVDSFVAATKSVRMLDEYHVPADSLEGYLFPDTYFFLPAMSGEKVVRMMVDNFFRRIKNISVLNGISPVRMHEIVILASIVEREYRVKSDAPLIASVFTNRLKKGIGLYSCATVEYIITEIEGKPHPDVITYDDLHIDNPYNTYKWAGLPPGPISNPGLIALVAAADPPKTNYYYFRLTDPSAGTHSFSSDFQAHVSEGHLLYTKSAAGK